MMALRMMRIFGRTALLALALLVCNNGHAGATPQSVIPDFGYTVASLSSMTAEEHLAAVRSTADALHACNSSYDVFFKMPSSVRFRDELKRNCEVAFGAGQYAVIFAANPAIRENLKATFKTRPDLMAFYIKAFNEINLQAAMMKANENRLFALSRSR